MTPAELHRATWIKCAVSNAIADEAVDIMAPWTTENPMRVLNCATWRGDVYVIARDKADRVTNIWRVE